MTFVKTSEVTNDVKFKKKKIYGICPLVHSLSLIYDVTVQFTGLVLVLCFEMSSLYLKCLRIH